MVNIVSTSTFVGDAVKFIRDLLDSNITDPISAKRSGRDRFVMTSYPSRSVKYPIITIRCEGPADTGKMGQRSELRWVKIPIEIRIWTLDEKQKDELTQDVFNTLRSNEYGSGSSTEGNLHDLSVLSTVPVDEPGTTGVRSNVMSVQYMFVLGA